MLCYFYYPSKPVIYHSSTYSSTALWDLCSQLCVFWSHLTFLPAAISSYSAPSSSSQMARLALAVMWTVGSELSLSMCDICVNGIKALYMHWLRGPLLGSVSKSLVSSRASCNIHARVRVVDGRHTLLSVRILSFIISVMYWCSQQLLYQLFKVPISVDVLLPNCRPLLLDCLFFIIRIF